MSNFISNNNILFKINICPITKMLTNYVYHKNDQRHEQLKLSNIWIKFWNCKCFGFRYFFYLQAIDNIQT